MMKEYCVSVKFTVDDFYHCECEHCQGHGSRRRRVEISETKSFDGILSEDQVLEQMMTEYLLYHTEIAPEDIAIDYKKVINWLAPPDIREVSVAEILEREGHPSLFDLSEFAKA